MSLCEFPQTGHRGEVGRYVIEYPEGRLSALICRKHAAPLRAFSKSMGRAPAERAVVDRKAATRPIDIDML